MTSEVSINAAQLGAQQQTLQGQSNKLSEDFDDFLVLLTTQLQNQDPLSPMESTEFTNQLVSFSQVEQQINQNQKLDQMLGLQLASTSTVALGYVGLDVGYVGDLFYSNGTDPREINYAVQGDAVKNSVFIRDADTGELVRTLDGVASQGNHSVTWDGLDDNGFIVPAGNYRVSVDALDKDDNAVSTSTAVSGRVNGIESVNGVVQLLLEGDAIVPVSSIINAKEPTVTVASNDSNDGGADDNATP
jgi:flagellar basal-body rod modification protein FlgD